METPYSGGAEEAVIGAVLTSPVAYLNVAAFLSSSDFFFLKHSYIWDAMDKLEKRGDAIDVVTVSEELQAMCVLAEIGGPAYLTQLIRNVPTSIHAEVYGGMVKRLSKRRELMTMADEIKVLAVDESLEQVDLFDKVESKLLEVTYDVGNETETDIESVAHRYLTSVEHLMELKKQGITPGLPTGFPPVDNIIGGSYRGEVIVIAGPLKSGKSTYNLNVARNRLKVGARVTIFITEMSAEAVTRKFVSMETGIPVSVIKDVSFESPQQYSLFFEALMRISKWKLHIIDDYPDLTPLDVKRELRKITKDNAVDAVLIDGLWQMKSNKQSHSITDHRNKELDDITKEIVKIAREFKVSIDLVHQCNRAADGRSDPRFRLSDLADSADIGRNVHTIIGLYRESFYKQDATDELEVIVAANRDGNVGTAKLQFIKACEGYEWEKPRSEQPITVPANSGDDRKDIYQ